MGRPYRQYINSPRIYCCAGCGTHAADADHIESNAFQGRHGRAFLVSRVVNVVVGQKEDRLLITGMHTVADISCGVCEANLGWVYLIAHEASERYKEGKYILEKTRLIKEGDWE